MKAFLLIVFLFNVARGATLCDNPTGPNCNPISTYNFANQESVAINYPVASPTTVNGITYDVVIQWTHQVGEVISFSWEIYPDRKQDRFDCSTSKMWFDGIEVGATTYFRGKKNDEPYCIFDMQNGILSNAYLQNPAQTVYFLLDDMMDDGDLMYIDKNRDLPIIPSDGYDPNLYDPTIVCVDPNGAQCNPISNIVFDVVTVEFDYPSPGSTNAINAGVFDVVIQWVPPEGTSIVSSWKVYPSRIQDPFDCANSRLWLNGTVVSATSGVDGGGIPYCIFDIHDGILSQAYIDTPGRTVFFLFDTLIGAEDTVFITEDYSKPIISSEDYDPSTDDPSVICDDPSPSTCNVITTVSFTGSTTSNFLSFTSPGSTIVGGVDYDMVIKWIDDAGSDIEYTWMITPDRTQDPFDCSTTKIWINGTIYPTITDVNGQGDDYCYFDIRDGVIPQAIIDDPEGLVFFLLDNPLLGPDDEFNLAINFDAPVVSIENYDPVSSNPSIVCDDPNGPNCNVISSVSFINVDPVTIDYSSPGLTTVDGVDYNSVVKWVVDTEATITHSWEIYPDRRQDLTTCDGVKMWFNGTIVGSTLYFRGAQNNEPYCVVDMQYGVLTQAIIDDPYNKVFFLFDNALGIGDTYYIEKNFDEPIVSRENVIFYLYDRVATTASTDSATGTTFTVTVVNLTYPDFPEFQGIGNCNSMETVMSTILIAECAIDVETVDNLNGVYTYYLPKELYYTCSYTFEPVNNDIEFTTELIFDEGTPQCKYFSPQVSTQSVVIEVPSNSMNGITPTERQEAQQDILNATIELCNPLLFPLPQITTRIAVNVSFGGESVELYGTPYLDTPENVLNIVSKVCTITQATDDRNYCIYTFDSTICRAIIPLEGGGCGVDRFFTHTIKNFKIREVVDSGTGTSFVEDFGQVPTSIGVTTFVGEICTMYDDFASFNINDQFRSIVKLRNRPNPDWETTQAFVTFFEPLIIEVSLENGGNGTATQLQIMNVEITVKDSATGDTVNKIVFNRGNKQQLLGFSWSPYYKDVHFCSSECGLFYQAGRNYTTPYITDVLIPQVFDICQTSGDTSSKDYFSFSPHNWFEGLNFPTLDLEINTVAIVNQCTGSGRRLTSEPYHVTTGSSVKMYTPVNRDPPRLTITGDFGKGALEDTKTVTSVLYAAVVTLSVISTISVYHNCVRYSHKRVSSVIDF